MIHPHSRLIDTTPLVASASRGKVEAMATLATVAPVKEQLVENVPKRFRGIKFGIQ